jgi:hypothetical protein
MRVERIAALPNEDGLAERRHTSFASKLCHFFVDAKTYPLYDTASRRTLKLHLGTEYDRREGYVAFCANLARLRQASSLQATAREVDWYLWIAGLCSAWIWERQKRPDRLPRMNRELSTVFDRPTPEQAKELEALLPESLWKQLNHHP